MTPLLPFSDDFYRGPDLGTGSGDVALIQGNLTGADINKTPALGTLLDSDEDRGSVLLSNLEGLVVVGHELVVMGRWGALLWCVMRLRVVSWLVVGCRGCCCGSWRAGSGCGGGPGRERPGYGVCLGLVCAGSRPGRRGRSAGRRRRTGTWRA